MEEAAPAHIRSGLAIVVFPNMHSDRKRKSVCGCGGSGGQGEMKWIPGKQEIKGPTSSRKDILTVPEPWFAILTSCGRSRKKKKARETKLELDLAPRFVREVENKLK